MLQVTSSNRARASVQDVPHADIALRPLRLSRVQIRAMAAVMPRSAATASDVIGDSYSSLGSFLVRLQSPVVDTAVRVSSRAEADFVQMPLV